MKSNIQTRVPKGFALIVTLTLMVLLTVLALGLLTLSSISLRSSGQASAMSVARANARMALMLAIGELQKSAGPDKAITATSEIVTQNPKKPNLTGVWDSWNFNVKSTNLDYASPKSQPSIPGVSPGFKGWLVSDGNAQVSTTRDYPLSGFSGESIELVGDGSLGKDALDLDKVRAGKVKVSRDGKQTGNYAWHVSEESVKARINTYRMPSQNQTLAQTRWQIAGNRPDVSVMKNSKNQGLGSLPNDLSPSEYLKAQESTGKVVSLNQAGLFGNAAAMKTFRNDVTPYSMGLLTNVREGGFKQDLTSVFELATTGSGGVTGLPTAFNGKKLYQTSVLSNGVGVTGVSDPSWSALAGYYNIYKEMVTPDSRPTLYRAPSQDVLMSSGLVQPTQYSIAPVIAKIELLFSFIVRDKHGPWKGGAGDYMGHLLYTPVFTLHNPYNVNLQFDRLKIGMTDIPVGFQFYINGVAQNAGMTPFSKLFQGASGKKDFWLELADWPSATASNPNGPITMKPGQTMVFGPYINENEPFGDNNASFFDYGNNKTGDEATPLKAKFGFSGKNIGFDVDWLKGGVFYLKKSDDVAIEFKSLAPDAATSFVVNATLTSKGVTRPYGGMSFNYGSQAVLDKVIPGVLRFPKQNGINAEVMHVANTVLNKDITQAKAFALFSAYARTSNGGVNETGKRSVQGILADGRLAGNPFLHNNPARAMIFSDLTRDKPATQSHELNMVALNGETDDTFEIAGDYRTNMLLGYKQAAGRSIKSGSYLEIPSGPLQSIADFRRSNVLASPYLPAFVQPIGNSYASPLMDTNTISQTGVATYALMDHSFLANHSLYDRTYFSTFVGVNGKSASSVFTDFMKDNKPLPLQLFQGYLPAGRTAEDVKAELFTSAGRPTATAYKLAAGYQMVKGAFNVNSTRVQAWKAMLSSMNKSDLSTLWAKSGALATVKGKGIPIPSMTMNNGSATNGTFSVANMDDQASNEWNGYREFSEADIETLATEIVKQVRLRGPFLSMSEFVNRRIGADSELTRMGALQNAIEDSKLNDSVFQQQVTVTEADVSNQDLYKFKTPKAATGNPAAGAPGWLSQADLMKVLEPAATVRSDTFVIRTCGEATDSGGKILARAYSEAVLQRIPEYVNPADLPSVNVYTEASAASENISFGRRFAVVSFRWLSVDEI